MNALFGQVLLFIGCVTYSFGQVPFDCNGRSFRVLAHGEGSYLQEIQQNKSDQTFSFTDLHYYPNQKINAIAYHPSQNVIYGILQTAPYRLCRIDATFNLEILETPPLPANLSFVSGDISPDEQHMVLFGFGNTNDENILALIDVQNGQYDTQIQPMQTSNPAESSIYCADIAFHPTTGKLFGFDFRHSRLVTLDIASRLIDNTLYPTSRTVSGNMPSIFFNAKGELFGIGAASQNDAQNRNFYQFELATGQATLLQKLGVENNQDACSCPYQIKLLNEVRQRKNAPCTELAFKLTLINKTNTEQFNLLLSDTFPENITIKRISDLPFDGLIENSIGRNVLTINSLYLPIGTFSFDIILEIDQNTSFGTFANQATVTGILLEGTELREMLSDDPQTAIPSDATTFSIDALDIQFSEEFLGICQNGKTTIHSNIHGANSYEWSTGAQTPAITVEAEGTYQVTVTTNCDQAIGVAKVTMDEISLELGVDRTIESGEIVQLIPNYSSDSPIKFFSWQTTNPQELNCPTCENPTAQPRSDTEVYLMIENESGCQTSDQLLLKVADFNIYTPNVFSPNNDNRNDAFYLQGNLPYDIAQFQIFDRWGNLLFQRNQIVANQAEHGWDGTINGELATQNAYIWKAEILSKDGTSEVLSGDVTLVRD